MLVIALVLVLVLCRCPPACTDYASLIARIGMQDAEALVIHLLLANYLRETCLSNDYGTVVYLVLGPCAERLLDRRTPADAEAFEERVLCVFERPARRQARRRSRVSHAAEGSGSRPSVGSQPTPGAEVRVRKGSASRTRKRKRVEIEYEESVIFSLSESEREDEGEGEGEGEDEDADGGGEAGSSSRGRALSFSFTTKRIARAAEDEHSESESLTVIGDARSAPKRKGTRETTEGARAGKQRGSPPRRKRHRRQMGMFAIDDDNDDDDDKIEVVNEGKNYWIPNMRDSVPPQSGWNARREEPIEISSD